MKIMKLIDAGLVLLHRAISIGLPSNPFFVEFYNHLKNYVTFSYDS